MKHKPLLIGLYNYSLLHPALAVTHDGCTGHRLWTMLHARTNATESQYIGSFERRVLVRGGSSADRLSARARAYEMVVELRDSGRTVVLLGGAVREAFDFALRDGEGRVNSALPPVLIHPQETGGCTWRQIPHPVGHHTWYNIPANRNLVEMLMEELYVGQR